MTDIAVALDHETARDALRVVDAAGDGGTWYKVGPVLYVREGPPLVEELLRRGKRVFLDLKWHDIPTTVAGAVAAASRMGVHLATLHVAGGRAMLAAAHDAKGELRLVGVGMLTSLTAGEYGRAVGREVRDGAEEQRRLARLAMEAGLDGMVCAAGEAASLRPLVGPGRLLVVPGIRRSGDAAGDQRRVATAREAAAAGADLLVIGRPITGASDPAAALAEFRQEIAA